MNLKFGDLVEIRDAGFPAGKLELIRWTGHFMARPSGSHFPVR